MDLSVKASVCKHCVTSRLQSSATPSQQSPATSIPNKDFTFDQTLFCCPRVAPRPSTRGQKGRDRNKDIWSVLQMLRGRQVWSPSGEWLVHVGRVAILAVLLCCGETREDDDNTDKVMLLFVRISSDLFRYHWSNERSSELVNTTNSATFSVSISFENTFTILLET